MKNMMNLVTVRHGNDRKRLSLFLENRGQNSVFRVIRWSTDFKECNSGRRRGVENGAMKKKQKHQKVDTRVLNDPMHDLSASESRLCV